MLAGRATWSAFKMWRAGDRTAPEWFAVILADMIEGRCRAGQEIVRELRDYRAPVHRNRGALQVQADGRDRRGGRIGRSGVSRDLATSGQVELAPPPQTNQAGEMPVNNPPKSS